MDWHQAAPGCPRNQGDGKVRSKRTVAGRGRGEFQPKGGAGPRAAIMTSDRTVFGRCWITLANDSACDVVTIPPCPSPPLFAGALDRFDVSKYSVCFRAVLTVFEGRYEPRACVRVPARLEPYWERQDITHLSSSSMSSNTNLFTENRRWPSGGVKIARCETPAMLRNRDDE